MRRLLLVLALASLALALALAAPAAPAADRSCRGFVVSGQEVRNLRALGVGCVNARRLARAWAGVERCSGYGGPEECRVRRFRCLNTNGPGFDTSVVCRRPDRRVRFRIGPAA